MELYGNGVRKLHSAMISLLGPGPQRNRLKEALVDNLNELNPEQDLPASIRSDFSAFRDQLIIAPPDSAQALAPVFTMSDWEIDSAAAEVLRFYEAVCREQRTH
ncbi:MAG: hypothetical protein ACPGZP_11310 [Panacagrimonas sp.]